MQFLVVAALVAIVHLATGIAAWTQVGLLADDREMVGAAILRHRGDWTLASAFLPPPSADATRALYRPFIDLLFWFEYPWFGIEAFGYHVVNSVMHCGTALLWFVLVRRWSGSAAAGLATAVLFVGWPGHSEVTHWIAARTNLQSVFFLSAALVIHDCALTSRGKALRSLLLIAAAMLAAVAVGSKESAVFVVPLAVVISWLRAEGKVVARLRRAMVSAAPIVAVVFSWLAWRASCLGTWGSGTRYGWRLERVDIDVCTGWLAVLLAPVHCDYLSAFWLPLLTALHAAGFVIACCALRRSAVRRVMVVGVTLIALGYLAGIGLEKLFVEVLQNVRYTYEPVLGLCAVLGTAVALLPVRARGVILAVIVLAHAWVLDHNRRSWLRASLVYDRMQSEVLERARSTQRPVRVLDAPGVHQGAFAYLNSYTDFLFWQQTAAPGTNLRGAVTSTLAWRLVLDELAQAAAAKSPVDAFVVRFADGALAPFVIDTQWPAEPLPGVQVLYARVARHGPFADSVLPVDVLIRTSVPIELQTRCEGTTMRTALAAAQKPQAIQVEAKVPAGSAGSPIAVDLFVVPADGTQSEQRYGLGTITPVAR